MHIKKVLIIILFILSELILAEPTIYYAVTQDGLAPSNPPPGVSYCTDGYCNYFSSVKEAILSIANNWGPNYKDRVIHVYPKNPSHMAYQLKMDATLRTLFKDSYESREVNLSIIGIAEGGVKPRIYTSGAGTDCISFYYLNRLVLHNIILNGYLFATSDYSIGLGYINNVEISNCKLEGFRVSDLSLDQSLGRPNLRTYMFSNNLVDCREGITLNNHCNSKCYFYCNTFYYNAAYDQDVFKTCINIGGMPYVPANTPGPYEFHFVNNVFANYSCPVYFLHGGEEFFQLLDQKFYNFAQVDNNVFSSGYLSFISTGYFINKGFDFLGSSYIPYANNLVNPCYIGVTGEFEVEPGSVVINNGAILPEVVDDFNHNARPQPSTEKPDIGAVEYLSSQTQSLPENIESYIDVKCNQQIVFKLRNINCCSGSNCCQPRIYYTTDGSTPDWLSSGYWEWKNGDVTTSAAINMPISLGDLPKVVKYFAIDGFGRRENINESGNNYHTFNYNPQLQQITLISPNGGEVLNVGSSPVIMWTSLCDINAVNIIYSLNEKTGWQYVAQNVPNTGYYSGWVIPQNAVALNCRVGVYDASNSLIFDESDNVFTIRMPQTINIVSPNGGGVYEAGSSPSINWTSTGVISDIKIEFSSDGGTSWSSIISSTSNTGTYQQWTTPSVTVPVNCKIRISNAADGTISATSGLFTITPQRELSLISPLAGVRFTVGFSPEIKWSSVGNISNVKLDYSIDNGASWQQIASLTNASPFTYTSWVIPVEAVSPNCKIKVSDASDATKYSIGGPYEIVSLLNFNMQSNLFVGYTNQFALEDAALNLKPENIGKSNIVATNVDFSISSPMLPEDYQLLSQSVAIDNGQQVPVITKDYLGRQRPYGLFDIGAFEYVPPPNTPLVIHVSSDASASDEYNGIGSRPLATLERALELLPQNPQQSVIIELAGGTYSYSGSYVVDDKGYTAQTPLTIKAADGANVVLTSNASDWIMKIPANWIRLEGLHFSGAGTEQACLQVEGKNVSVNACSFEGANLAIDCWGQGFVFTNSILSDCSIETHYGSLLSGYVIANNTIIDADYFIGINNTSASHGLNNDVIIRNNIVMRSPLNTSAGYFFKGGSSDYGINYQFDHNVYWNLSGITQGALTVTGTNNINADPFLENIADKTNPNFIKPKWGSPTVNAGIDMSSLFSGKDYYGNTRPSGSGWDIGAVEFVKTDFEPPVISIAGIADGGVYAFDVSPLITVTDNLDPAPTITAVLNGDPYNSGTPISQDGNYSLVVAAQDHEGNQVSKNVSFSIRHFIPEFKSGLNVYSIGTMADKPVGVNSITPINATSWSIQLSGDPDLSRVFPNDCYKDVAAGETHRWKIVSVDDATNLITVQNSEYQSGSQIQPGGANASIGRWFFSPQNWVSVRKGNLVAENRIEKGLCYNDGLFSTTTTIIGSITDTDHYMWLTVAPSERHKGKAGTGAAIRLSGVQSYQRLITVGDSCTKVEWLELDGNTSTAYTYGVNVNSKRNCLSNLIIHDMTWSGISVNDYASRNVIENCIVYNCQKSPGYQMNGAIQTKGPGYDTLHIYNTTVYNNPSTFGIGCEDDNGWILDTRNVIAVGNPHGDFSTWPRYADASASNVSSDASAKGTGSLMNVATSQLFTDISSSVPDLHLKAGSPALGAGLRLAQYFSDDIDGEARKALRWDIGADEYGLGVADAAAPEITISGVAENGVYTGGATPQISIADNLDPAPQVTITLNGAPYFSGALIETDGNHTLVVTATDWNSNTSSQTVHFTVNHWLPFTWTGKGSDNNWTTSANWQGGVVPGVNETAIFTNATTKTCRINSNVTVKGISILSNSTSELQQLPGYTFTVQSNGFKQAGGIFTGGNSNISVVGPFQVTGGVFTSTSGNLTLQATSTQTFACVASAFVHNGGTVTFLADITSINAQMNNVVLNNCVINEGGTITVTGKLIVDGTLTLVRCNASIAGDTIVAQGNVVSNAHGEIWNSGTILFGGSKDQLVRAGYGMGGLPSKVVIQKSSGVLTLQDTLRITRNWTYLSGTVNATNSTIMVSGGGTNPVIQGGSMVFGNLLFALDYGTVTLIGTNRVQGKLIFKSNDMSFTGDTLLALGNVESLTRKSIWGSATLAFGGSTNQSASANGGTGPLPAKIVIDKTDGILTLSDTLKCGSSWYHLNGTVNPGTSTICLYGSGTPEVKCGSMMFNNLHICNEFNRLALLDVLHVKGDLQIYNTITITGGVIHVGGNLTSLKGVWSNSTASIILDGTGTQTVAGSGSYPFPCGQDLTVSKTAGKVVLGANLTLAQCGLNITSGTFDQGNGCNLVLKNGITVGPAGTYVNNSTGDITLGGNVTNSGIVTLNGNGLSCGEGDSILIRSSVAGTQRSWAGSGVFNVSDVDVKDQTASATIRALHSTNSGNVTGGWNVVPYCREYVAEFKSGQNEYSIGQLADIPVSVAAMAGKGPWTLTFSNTPNLTRVFRNDKFTDAEGRVWKISSVNQDLSQITIVNSEYKSEFDPIPVINGNIQTKVGRFFASMQAWVEGRKGNLVTENRIEKGVCYNDGLFTAPVVIEGSNCDENHYMWLTVAEGERHTGIAGTGVRIKVDQANYTRLVSIVDKYTHVQWLELDGTHSVSYTYGVNVKEPSEYPALDHLLIHDMSFFGINIGELVSGSIISNCIIYNVQNAGGGYLQNGGIQATEYGEMDTIHIWNTTIYGTVGTWGIGCDWDDFWIYDVRNTICMDNPHGDFTTWVRYAPTSGANISSDATAPGSASFKHATANQVLKNPSGVPKNLHVAPGGVALGNGLNLSSLFMDDIDGETRPSTAWDIGADELLSTDVTPPMITVTGVMQDGLYGNVRTYNVTVSDDVDPAPLLHVSLNNVAVEAYGSVTTEGLKTLVVEASDATGNVSRHTVVFRIDFTGPVMSSMPLGGERSIAYFNNPDSGVTLFAHDMICGIRHIYYTLDGSEPTYASPVYLPGVLISPIQVGQVVKCYAEDSAGNNGATASFVFTARDNNIDTNVYSIGTLTDLPISVSGVSGDGPCWTILLAHPLTSDRIFRNDCFRDGSSAGRAWKIARVFADSLWVVNSEDNSIPPSAEAIKQAVVGRWFNTLQDWNDARTGDLISRNAIEKGVCYNDGEFNGSPYGLLDINGAVTDSLRFMWLTVAPGESHMGLAGHGVRINHQGNNNVAISISTPFTLVEGLEIFNLGTWGAKAVALQSARCVVRNMLIHDVGGTGYGIYVHEGNGGFTDVIQNNIIYHVAGTGITSYQNLAHEPGNLIINNTVFGCGVGISVLGTRGGPLENDTLLNNISIGNTTDYNLSLSSVFADYNAGGIGLIPAEGTQNVETTPANEFVNIISGSINLHLKDGAFSINSGIADSRVKAVDVDGTEREGTWDIGADEK